MGLGWGPRNLFNHTAQEAWHLWQATALQTLGSLAQWDSQTRWPPRVFPALILWDSLKSQFTNPTWRPITGARLTQTDSLSRSSEEGESLLNWGWEWLFLVANKALSSQSYGFSSSHVWCECWTIKKAEHWRIDAFELWCWRRLLRVPWTARRSNQPILKEINPEYSLEGLMLKLKLQYFGHLMRRTDSLEKTLMLEKIEGWKRRGW